jgi:hypothetical protein
MRHDELLEEINFLPLDGLHAWFQPALRAIVELHKPDESDFPDEWESCVECSGNGYVAMYPCQTIKVIELNLQ